MNPTKPDTQPANLPVEKADAAVTHSPSAWEVTPDCTHCKPYRDAMGDLVMPVCRCSLVMGQIWRCSCGTPSLPGVLHRADRPCAAVRDEGDASC
jgi:hypothetical protein